MRKYAISAILAITIAVLLLQVAPCNAQAGSCRSDEYELMSLLVREQYGSEFSLILIGRDTETWCLREQLSFLQRRWPRLRSETIDSLIVGNSGAPQCLAAEFDLPVEYRLISEAQYLEALRGGEGEAEAGTLAAGSGGAASGAEAYASISGSVEPDWDGFDRTFPDAQGYLTFSRVAFDSDCTQALVIFSNSYRCSGAHVRPDTRKIAFFSMRHGSWELEGISRGIKAAE
jgi:hypothetical protein